MNTEKCGFCGCAETTTIYDLHSHKIVKCVSCGLMRLSPMPSMDHIGQIYVGLSYFQNPEFYDFKHGNLYGYVDYIAERVNRVRQHRPIAKFLHERSDRTETGRTTEQMRPRLLDIGCGLGYFLDVAQDVGFDVTGVEFNPGAVRAIREEHAFPVYEGAVETLPLQPASFDVVTMFDVIEHLHNPFSTLECTYKLLRPGGIVAISTMDSESFMSRLLGKRLEDFRRTREHLYFFSRKSITNVLESRGFTVRKIRSYGHTFEMAFLLERMAIINRPIFLSARWLVMKLGMGHWRISVDPHTKMIVYAEKPCPIND